MSNTRRINDARTSIGNRLKRPTSRLNLKKIAEASADDIRRRTRLGFGVERNGAPRQRLQTLSPAWKKKRGQLKGDLNTALTSPNRSNLTLSGQMLAALTSRINSSKSFTLLFRPSRRPYNFREGRQYTNAEIANFAHEGDRPFLFYTNRELERLKRRFVDIVVK